MYSSSYISLQYITKNYQTKYRTFSSQHFILYFWKNNSITVTSYCENTFSSNSVYLGYIAVEIYKSDTMSLQHKRHKSSCNYLYINTEKASKIQNSKQFDIIATFI